MIIRFQESTLKSGFLSVSQTENDMQTPPIIHTDVLCVGHASYDLVFSVSHHPAEDEKLLATGFVGCGGGPAANAAVTVSRLGYTSAFSGYLGNDLYGEKHLQEFIQDNVNTDLVVRGSSPTPISTVIVKPDGKRALINFKGETHAVAEGTLDFSNLRAKVVLFDGHEPEISLPLAKRSRDHGIPTILDAGSLHTGTKTLMDQVDYLVCSEKFAIQIAGNYKAALNKLAEVAPAIVITLGEKGLIWRRGQESGSLPAFKVAAIDTTGAGDAFHGAFSAALTTKMDWHEILRFSSAAGSFCCTKTGAREGLPFHSDLCDLL